MNYYNDNDPRCADWLRNLIAEGYLPAGDVDDRDIREIQPSDLKGYTQVHLFAGIGGWPYALMLAGWDGPAWTGSCPCQPFSNAGKRKGTADERHLWPEFHRLIRECDPPVVFGEQVASKIGRDWLATVRADLEALGYAFGAADLCAAGVGAPHIRQRLYFVAERMGDASTSRLSVCKRSSLVGERRGQQGGAAQQSGCAPRRMADPEHHQQRQRGGSGSQSEAWHEARSQSRRCGSLGRLAHADGGQSGQAGAIQSSREHRQQSQDGCSSGRLADRASSGWREEREDVDWLIGGDREEGLPAGPVDGGRDLRPSPTNGFWRAADWLFCRDGKWRPAQPGTFPLAHGIPGRVGLLRGYGNAIVPQVAAEFVLAYMEASADDATASN